MSAFVHVGTSHETVAEARKAILDILENTNTENSTKMKALDVLGKLCETQPTTFQGCYFNTERNAE